MLILLNEYCLLGASPVGQAQHHQFDKSMLEHIQNAMLDCQELLLTSVLQRRRQLSALTQVRSKFFSS